LGYEKTRRDRERESKMRKSGKRRIGLGTLSWDGCVVHIMRGGQTVWGAGGVKTRIKWGIGMRGG